jgi:alkaline phosphatase D
MLGAEQRAWLFEGLTAASTSWNVLANQVSFAPIDTAGATSPRRNFNRDNWDGYVAERQAIIDVLKTPGVASTVVITGDKHQNSVRNVPPDYRTFDGAPVATEFIGTSISSEGDDGVGIDPAHNPEPRNPHLLYDDFHRGWVRVTLDQGRWTNEFRVVDSVVRRNQPGRTLDTFVVENGRPGAHLL